MVAVQGPLSYFSNPSVISGSRADLHGPRVSAINYPVFGSDSASLNALLSGQTNIMDRTPSNYSVLQTALNTKYLNVTSEAGSNFNNILFNMFSAKDPGFYLPFRQAFAHLINYGYIQNTVLNGVQGIATPNLLLPSLFGEFSTNNINVYQHGLKLANQSLAQDPEIAWNATQPRPAPNSAIACDGTTKGVWDFATSLGSHIPNGTYFEPNFITRPDHPTWFLTAQRIWHDAAKIGLCISLQQVVHFSNVFPIIYAQYSDNWGVYDGGICFCNLLDPILLLYFGFTRTPGWTSPFDNTEHFHNATVESLLHDEFKFSSSNITRAEQDSRQVIIDLSQQIPQVNLWWDSANIPSLNNFNGQFWSGYVDVPAFSSWSVASNVWTSLNAHMINSTTGMTIVGGTLGVGQVETPDNFNPFQATSISDFDILKNLYDSPVVPSPSNPTISGLIPWMVTKMPTATFNVNTITPHGYRLIDGTVIKLQFYNNITFADNVRMTAADYNFSLWYANANGAAQIGPGKCSAPCWLKYANDSSADFTFLLPALVDSTVDSATSATVYMNGSSLEDYEGPIIFPVFPEHLWSQVNNKAFNADINPITNQVDGSLLIAGTGPFYFSSFVSGQNTFLNRNPSYFRTDIVDWSLKGEINSSVPLSFNLTQMGTPIPSNSKVNAIVLRNGKLTGLSTSLNPSGSLWVGNLVTAGVKPGSYEIVVNGTYRDSFRLRHEALQFWGLKLGRTGFDFNSLRPLTKVPWNGASDGQTYNLVSNSVRLSLPDARYSRFVEAPSSEGSKR